jgi:hypothetical protein
MPPIPIPIKLLWLIELSEIDAHGRRVERARGFGPFQTRRCDYLEGMLQIRMIILGMVVVIATGVGAFLGFQLPRMPSRATAPTPMNTATLIQEVQGLSELVTVKYVLEKVVVLEDARWYGDNRVLLLAHGVVKGGVDLRRLGPEDLALETNQVTITLPPAAITDVYLDENKTRVIEHSTGLLRAFDKDLQIAARRHAVDELRRSALQNGIHEDAQEQARQLLSRFFDQLGLETRFNGP